MDVISASDFLALKENRHEIQCRSKEEQGLQMLHMTRGWYFKLFIVMRNPNVKPYILRPFLHLDTINCLPHGSITCTCTGPGYSHFFYQDSIALALLFDIILFF